MASVALSTHAMATRFEIVLYGDDPVRLRAAGEEALAEIERLDCQLSFYRPDSDLSSINARAAEQPVKVEPRMFRLLERAAEISRRMDGAFDITIPPLMRLWGFIGGTQNGRAAARFRSQSSGDELEAARAVAGIEHIHLDPDAFTISFDRPGVEVDLGAIGKGYAIEQAIELLRETGVESALIHGGTSSVSAIGTQPGGAPWRIAARHPTLPDAHIDVVDLKDSSLSVSATHGKVLCDGAIRYGHVMDPRTGRPSRGGLAALATGPSATVCDALSTALLVLGEPGLEVLADEFPNYSAKVLDNEPGTPG